MTPLQQDPSAQAPWTRTIFGRPFISLPSSLVEVSVVGRGAGAHRTILRFESFWWSWDMLGARSRCRRSPRGTSMGATRNSR